MSDRPSVVSIDLLLATVQSAGVIAILFLLPGLTLGRVLGRGATTPLGHLGRAAGVSLLTTSVACTLLAAVGALRPTIVVAVILGLTILPWHDVRPQRLRLPRGRARRWWLGALAAVAVVLVLVMLPSRLEVGPSLRPFTSTVWYYGMLSERMASAGAIPATIPEWGTDRAFHPDYLPFTAHAAAAFQLLPGDLMARMEVYRLALLGAGALLAALLFRRWLSSWLAVLAGVLLLATERLSFKFVSFKPETFGLVLMLFALWAFDRALVERTRRMAALAFVSTTVTFLAHAEVFLVLAAFAAGIALARLVVAPFVGRRRPRDLREAIGLRAPGVRRTGLVAGLTLLVVGGGLVAGSLGNAALAGEMRIIGYVTGNREEALTPIRVPDAPPGWTFTQDPTWDFYVAAVAPGQLGREAPSRFTDPRLLPRAILHVWPGLDARLLSMLPILATLVAAPFLAWPWLDGRRRRLAAAAGVFSVALLAGSVILFELSSTYVPMRVGPRRLMPYELLLPVVAAAIVLWGLDRLLRPGWHALLPHRGEDDPLATGRTSRLRLPRIGAMAAAGLLLAVVTAAMVAPVPPESGDAAEAVEEGRISAAGLGAWQWVAANTAPGARILANAYTDGVVAALGKRTGIVDGRAVYLEDREFLAESTGLLLEARTLFLDPLGDTARRYLARERVDYLLVADVAAGASGSDLGGYLPFETDVAALDRGYTLMRTFGDGALRLYAVAGPDD